MAIPPPLLHSSRGGYNGTAGGRALLLSGAYCQQRPPGEGSASGTASEIRARLRFAAFCCPECKDTTKSLKRCRRDCSAVFRGSLRLLSLTLLAADMGKQAAAGEGIQ